MAVLKGNAKENSRSVLGRERKTHMPCAGRNQRAKVRSDKERFGEAMVVVAHQETVMPGM